MTNMQIGNINNCRHGNLSIVFNEYGGFFYKHRLVASIIPVIRYGRLSCDRENGGEKYRVMK